MGTERKPAQPQQMLSSNLLRQGKEQERDPHQEQAERENQQDQDQAVQEYAQVCAPDGQENSHRPFKNYPKRNTETHNTVATSNGSLSTLGLEIKTYTEKVKNHARMQLEIL